ncbi:MAG: RNA polymerase sigma factor [Thermodesulfobacteriota bacterium]|nr:RNA polymerase sigma factor [Thermodesulfobacteriota bacterium]
MAGNGSTDKDLILSFQQTQSQKTFEILYDRYASFVYRKCLIMTESEVDAQDLTQEIWIKAYFALDTFRFESKFSTWLGRITINTCINYLKKRGKFVFSGDIEESENGSLPNIDDCLDVTKLLSQLSIEIKVLLTLKYVEGLSYEEIAEASGIGVSAVKMRIARAKKQLIKYYP